MATVLDVDLNTVIARTDFQPLGAPGSAARRRLGQTPTPSTAAIVTVTALAKDGAEALTMAQELDTNKDQLQSRILGAALQEFDAVGSVTVSQPQVVLLGSQGLPTPTPAPHHRKVIEACVRMC